jgi:hypothetical protein
MPRPENFIDVGRQCAVPDQRDERDHTGNEPTQTTREKSAAGRGGGQVDRLPAQRVGVVVLQRRGIDENAVIMKLPTLAKPCMMPPGVAATLPLGLIKWPFDD